MSLLDHLRVLDLTVAWAGPLAGRFLADLGAEVIHIERPTGRGGSPSGAPTGWKWGQLPEPNTRAGIYPDADPGMRPWNRSGTFNKINRNKRSLCLDLKHPAGADILQRLVAESDVLIDNNSVRALAGLGFDYHSVAAINPRMIMLSMPGFGMTGPYAEWLSLGPILEAASGLAGVSGYPDGTPLKLGIAFPDAIGGLHAVVAVLSALWDRENTGHGCFVDLSQQEAYAAIGGELILAASLLGVDPPRLSNRSAAHAPQGVYPCVGEDEWIALTVRNDEEWCLLRDMLGDASLNSPSYETVSGRFSGHDAIDEVIRTWTQRRSKWDAADQIVSLGIPAAPVLTNGDLVNDPHLAERGFVVGVDQPDVGVRQFPGFPIHFSENPITEFRGASPLGGDNIAVLRDILHMSDEDIRALADKDVIRTEPRSV